ncbi:MAG: histidine kinase [Bacteroidales bacterium]
MSTVKKKENLVYLGVWLIIVAVSVVSIMTTLSSFGEGHSLWKALLRTSVATGPFLLLFLIHNYLLAPLVVDKNRITLYAILTTSLVTAFAFLTICSNNPPERHGDMGKAPMMEEHFGQRPPQPPHEGPGRKEKIGPYAPTSPEMLKIFVAALMVLANLGVKYYFHFSSNRQRMLALERENLDQQLQYLRYQINPHFFMNTLNNIHALVDIDPDEAKSCIVELSKLMRYVLYEGSKPTILLEKETEFLRQYVGLMRIRYSDNVKISVSLPETSPGIEIPPLLFISFVENAFKHGISYRKDSFIDISMSVEGDHLHFRCVNSRHESNHDPLSGIGLDNVKKRLDLLFGGGYELKTAETEDKYDVSVSIPVSFVKSEEL